MTPCMEDPRTSKKSLRWRHLFEEIQDFGKIKKNACIFGENVVHYELWLLALIITECQQVEKEETKCSNRYKTESS